MIPARASPDMKRDFGDAATVTQTSEKMQVCAVHIDPLPAQVAIYAGRGAKHQMTAGRIKHIIAFMRLLLQEQEHSDVLQILLHLC